MHRVKLFYDTTKGTQYLEEAVKYIIKVKNDESEVLMLYLTPVGVNRKPDSIGKLHIDFGLLTLQGLAEARRGATTAFATVRSKE